MALVIPSVKFKVVKERTSSQTVPGKVCQTLCGEDSGLGMKDGDGMDGRRKDGVGRRNVPPSRVNGT